MQNYFRQRFSWVNIKTHAHTEIFQMGIKLNVKINKTMNPMLRAAVVFILMSLAAIEVTWSQLPAITFEVITTKDGLPSNTVLSATRDHAGFMWFGTRQCPVRYDGVSFKSFTSYTTNFVTGIQTDKHNNIWVSSDRTAISVINGKTLQMKPISGDVKHKGSTGDFYIDKYGSGWFSDHHGINRIDLNTHKQHRYPFRQTNFIWLKASFVEDLDSNLWVIGRDNGLFRYDRQQDTLICVIGADNGKPDQFDQLLGSRAILGVDGFLWIGTYNFGLLKFDPRTHAVEIFPTGRPENQVLSLQEGFDENGKRILWIGDNQGLGIFRPDLKKFYFFSGILPKSYEVNFIYRDPDDIVWICTTDGILKYHPRSNVIQAISIPHAILPEAVDITAIHQDKRPGYENKYYLGTSSGLLLQWDRQENEFSRIVYPASAAETKWIEQRNEMLWIGTNRWDYERPGIFVYDLDRGQFVTSPLTRAANQFFSVPFFMYGFLKENKLWIGNSDEGIHVLQEEDGKIVTSWADEAIKKLIHNNNLINDIMVDKKGRLWVGSYKGVFRYDEKKNVFESMDPDTLQEGMDDSTVNSLIEDSVGNVWAARWGSLTMTSEGGKLLKVIGAKDGFGDREIKGLTLDYAGNIWVGNHEGLYCYQLEKDQLTRFTMNDGLLNNNTSNQIFISNDRRELFVGHIQAFNVVKTNEVLRKSEPPPLVVNSFKIHQTEYPVDESKVIRLSPSQNVFSVDFVALNYRKQDDNQYAYYLEGFEEDWNHIGSKHIAYYTNLNPGTYTLHMKSGDSFGNWNEDILKLNIEVLPAFYETIWFKILVSLFIAGILYAFYQYRINQLLHLQQVRNRISADLHDELGSTLSGISIMGSLAKKQLSDPQTSGLLVDRIMDDVRQISSSIDDIVWNISPKNDSLSSLIARMTRYASELFEAKLISFKFDIPEAVEGVKLSMEQRRNIYLIFKESINNLVKYSKCTEAFVGIGFSKGHLHLTIRDNGIGFDPAAPTDRNGLRNLKDRAHHLKGRIDIQSTVGMGTSIQLQLPVQ